LQPERTTIHYEQFMRPWQLFEMLPPMAQTPADGGWLGSAVYQHLWIGIYAPRVEIPIPVWSPEEVNILADTPRDGLESFTACKYSAA